MHLLPTALILACYGHLIHALITQSSIRNLTAVTDDCRAQITGVSGDSDGMARVLMGQVVLGGGGEDDGEIEDVSTFYVL